MPRNNTTLSGACLLMCLVRSAVISQTIFPVYKYPSKPTTPSLPSQTALDHMPMASLSTIQASSSSPLCSMCPNPGTWKCSQCHCSRYCSKVCQKDDWRTHKLLCNSYQDFDQSLAPSPSHFRAIFFSEDGEGPIFLWLRIDHCTTPGHAYTIGFETVPFPPPSHGYGSPQVILDIVENRILKRPHERIGMLGFLAPNANGQVRLTGRPSTSLRTIDPELFDGYRGPLLFCGRRFHLDTMSFRHVIDDLRTNWYDAKINAEKNMSGPIEGVRVNCYGDTVVSKRPQYEKTNVDNTFFATQRPFKIPVGEKIDIPLEVQQMKVAVSWRRRHVDGNGYLKHSHNKDAQILNPAQWTVRTGSIMIVRKDLKPLHRAHVEALRDYCQRVGWGSAQLYHLLGGPYGPDEDLTPSLDINYQASSVQLLNDASKEDFEAYFAYFMQTVGTAKYGHVPSPYEV